MTSVLLALVASACWGASDFAGGVMSRRLPVLVVMLGQQFAALVVVSIVVVAAGEGPPDQRTVVLSLLAGAVGALGLATFYRALALGTMSIVAPISTIGVVVPVAVGVATGDRPSAVQAAGLALAVAGVLLASREVSEEGGTGGPAPGRRASIVLAFVAAACLGTYFTLSDAAADGSVLWLLLLGRCAAIPLLLAAGAATRTLRLPRPRELAAVAAIGFGDLVATGLYAVALTQGLLSIVSVVGSLYPVMTVLLAWLVLRERLQPAQAVGVALAFTGVAAVAAG